MYYRMSTEKKCIHCLWEDVQAETQIMISQEQKELLSRCSLGEERPESS